jgi:hypothetical protein
MTLIVGRTLMGFSVWFILKALHALEVGVMKYMVGILMKELPTDQHGTLNGL